jgi:hypothetical protein
MMVIFADDLRVFSLPSKVGRSETLFAVLRNDATASDFRVFSLLSSKGRSETLFAVLKNDATASLLAGRRVGTCHF